MPDNYYSEVNENGVVTPLKDLAAFPRSEQAVLGAKNIIKNNLASSSTANVEVVVNSDKSVSMSNTANADVWLTVYSGLNFLPKGHWHLNGCPSNGGAEKYFLCFIVRNADNTANETTYYDYGDGVDFDITDTNINRSIRIYIYVKSGQATDFTYYPMISLDGGSYVAPAMTNRELTTKHEIKDVAFAGGTGIDVRPATSVKIEDKLLSGYFALKNDTENNMASNTVIGTISGITVHHGVNWVLPAIITDNMTNTAVMLSHDNTNNTITIKNQTSLPAGNVLAFSFTEYLLKA